MTDHSLIVRAPARIHFGWFSIGGADRQFGGMGVMIDSPETAIQIGPADKLQIAGPRSDTVAKLVDRWFEKFKQRFPQISQAADLPLRLELQSCPPSHSGFGSGTQLAFAVAHALFRSMELTVPAVEEVAGAMGRGRRSAIGSYGFSQGGFLVDSGIGPGESISPLEFRCDFPDEWRIVIARPSAVQGVHGKLESQAFDKLVACEANRERLSVLCREQIVPAIRTCDYQALGEPLAEFNEISGEYFKEYQHGCYHSELCECIVRDIQSFGVPAVGQSSWGPALFSITENAETAEQLGNYLIGKYQADLGGKIEISITQANNRGAVISVGSLAPATKP